jgi:PIN domain nuclease of toxin-antitoxin system
MSSPSTARQSLLDTHALLWFLGGDEQRIAEAVRSRIEDGGIVSSASIWEIAIKKGLGKLDAPDDLPERLGELGFELLPINADHAWRVQELPMHHRDPFDRLLIAQAQIERLQILSADPGFADYEVEVVWE